MSKGNYKSSIAWGIVLGLSISIVILLSKVEIRKLILPLSLALGIIFLITFGVGLYFGIKKSYIPVKLMNDGEYQKAIEVFNEMHEKYDGRYGYKGQGLYGIANCYNRMGNFATSINYLDKINSENLDRNTGAGVYGLYAHNLYFLNQDLNRARELAEKSRKLLEMPEVVLTLALIGLELEGKEKADKLVEEYYKSKTNGKTVFGFFTILVIDKFSKEVSENFLLGLYYYKTGETLKAIEYLNKSAEFGYDNYFSNRSKELLKDIGKS